ncbi:hypothetical protein Syun_011655 [Stephania yunnanensis]|uniref:Uncharacterized protein n=1 Tax=Stephania yunnanensis TaxID=152371 RepID=A0AAP0PIB3_9MAGN
MNSLNLVHKPQTGNHTHTPKTALQSKPTNTQKRECLSEPKSTDKVRNQAYCHVISALQRPNSAFLLFFSIFHRPITPNDLNNTKSVRE